MMKEIQYLERHENYTNIIYSKELNKRIFNYKYKSLQIYRKLGKIEDVSVRIFYLIEEIHTADFKIEGNLTIHNFDGRVIALQRYYVTIRLRTS